MKTAYDFPKKFVRQPKSRRFRRVILIPSTKGCKMLIDVIFKKKQNSHGI